jgi:hypothetical protein
MWLLQLRWRLWRWLYWRLWWMRWPACRWLSDREYAARWAMIRAGGKWPVRRTR